MSGPADRLQARCPDFQWGAATSAFQIEGALRAGGRGPSIWDTFCQRPGAIAGGDTGERACEHHARWREDVELIAGLGLNAYRFSIAWPRVQPTGHGLANFSGLGFYDRLVDRLLERGVQPHATLYHWDLPQALEDEGGWRSRDTALRFADYAALVAERFGDRLASLATHNEPWVSAELGHARGVFAPGLRDPLAASRASHHLLLSHGLAVAAIRAHAPSLPAGIVLNMAPAWPATDSASDGLAAAREYTRLVRWYADPLLLGRYPDDQPDTPDRIPDSPVRDGDFALIAAPTDFLGINYYTRLWISTSTPPVPAPGREGFSEMDWETYPQGLLELFDRLRADYPALPPLVVAENGFAAADAMVDGRVDDITRRRYLQLHVEAVRQARARGDDIRGYFVWSLLDNFEWASGYAKRFGIVHVNYATQRRTVKESGRWYAAHVAAARERERSLRGVLVSG